MEHGVQPWESHWPLASRHSLQGIKSNTTNKSKKYGHNINLPNKYHKYTISIQHQNTRKLPENCQKYPLCRFFPRVMRNAHVSPCRRCAAQSVGWKSSPAPSPNGLVFLALPHDKCVYHIYLFTMILYIYIYIHAIYIYIYIYTHRGRDCDGYL